MDHDISPGIERAAAEATERATRRNETQPRLSDWLHALLAEEEGRPWDLLTRVGLNVPTFLGQLESVESPLAPRSHDLYVSAKRHSVRLRAEPSLTSDLVLLAALTANESYATSLTRFGLNLASIENSLRSPMMVAPITNDPPPPPTEFLTASPQEPQDVARILDVNLNRARESLRILDDYTRFALNDRILTEELKSLRHQLVEAAEFFPPMTLLQSRDAQHDVGTTIETPSEYERGNAHQVAVVNFKRLQESLRSLEEFGKLGGQAFARAIEQLRYRAYTLEKATFASRTEREKLAAAKVYVLLTASQCANSRDWIIAEAAMGGATIFQLREKELTDRELLASAREMRKWTQKAGVLFIVNDRPDIARLADADGVHLGQDDLNVADARRILGPSAIVGVSTHNLEQVRQAVLDGADYLGVGPTFTSTTKQFNALAGLKFVREAFAATSLPAFALGGITPHTIGEVAAAGATRVAVSAAVAEAEEPRHIVEQLRGRLG